MSQTAQERFQTLIQSVAPILQRAGFRKRRQLFTRFQAGIVGVVQFQKSTSSTQDRVTFTINLGVWSALVSASEGRRRTAAMVTAPDCHWRERIGMLLPARQDTWWEITSETDIDALATEISDILEQSAVPAVLALTPDTGLRDHWLAGGSAGTTEFCRLTYLAALVRALGPEEACADIEQRLRALEATREERLAAQRAELMRVIQEVSPHLQVE